MTTKLFAAITMAFSGFTLAHEVPAQEVCAVINGQNVYGSSGSIPTPVFRSYGSQWWGQFFITNVSEYPVTVKLEFTTPQAQIHTPYSLSYQSSDMFSSSNTPVSVSGAVLQAGEMGSVQIKDPNTQFINVGKLTWESDACISKALMAGFRNQYNSNGSFDNGWYYLNDSMPF